MRIAGLKKIKEDKIPLPVEPEISVESIEPNFAKDDAVLSGKLSQPHQSGSLTPSASEPRELVFAIELNPAGDRVVTAYVLSSLWDSYTKFIKLIYSLTERDTLHLHIGTTICSNLSELKNCKARVVVYIPVITSVEALVTCLYADKVHVGRGSKLILSGYKTILYGTEINMQDRNEVGLFERNIMYATVLYAGILTEDDLRMVCMKNRSISMFGKELQAKLDEGINKLKNSADLDRELLTIAENLTL